MQGGTTIRIAGEAGQGIQTIGMALCRLINDCGYNFLANQDYMSRVRGGNNYYQVRMDSTRPLAFGQSVDVLVPLNTESILLHQADLAPKSWIIVDKQHFKLTESNPQWIDAPLMALALSAGGTVHYVGSVALGVLAGLLRINVAILEQSLHNTFADKGDDIATRNTACALAGFTIGKKAPLVPLASGSPFSASTRRYLVNGNESIALGAAYAGCRFYAGYPMTPSTTIMETIAGFSTKYPLVVEQVEDEIAAINMIIGASYAGVKSMTATSGGGFALMTEGLSLAAMLETPIVIVNGQRPAPATGLPTRTEQADLNLVIHAGHGEFARVVYAPGNLEEAFATTVKAFDCADRFQIPAIILSDQYLADLVYAVDRFDTATLKRDRHVLSREQSTAVSDFSRYELTDTGISVRVVPSWISDVVYADSDEHSAKGHITEDGAVRTAMVNKRFTKKMNLLRKEIIEPIAINLAYAEIVLLGFGSTRGVIAEVCATENSKIGAIHFGQVWPFPGEALGALLNLAPHARLITVEHNAGAQLAGLIARETRLIIETSILKYNGRPFTIEELSGRIDYVR